MATDGALFRGDSDGVASFDLGDALPTLFTELVYGCPDPHVGTYMLNRGDEGLLQSLRRLSAADASRSLNGGAPIAAHVDHLRYGLSRLNEWASGAPAPWNQADWTLSWRLTSVDEQSWNALVDELDREARAWLAVVGTPRKFTPRELKWTLGSIAHLAYHLGAIRQIDRGARGPTAEDEQRFERSQAAP
jgi:hypothetical protein